MNEHFRKHWFLYIFFLLVLIATTVMPDVKATIYGGLAWFYVLATLVVIFMMILCIIFGGSISFESEGLIPKLKKWKTQGNKNLSPNKSKNK